MGAIGDKAKSENEKFYVPIESRHRGLSLFLRGVDYSPVASIFHPTGHPEIRSENVSGVAEELIKVQRTILRRPL